MIEQNAITTVTVSYTVAAFCNSGAVDKCHDLLTYLLIRMVTNSVQAVKIREHEGRANRFNEQLKFFIFILPGDIHVLADRITHT